MGVFLFNLRDVFQECIPDIKQHLPVFSYTQVSMLYYNHFHQAKIVLRVAWQASTLMKATYRYKEILTGMRKISTLYLSVVTPE